MPGLPDFVLSRFRGEPELMDRSPHHMANDCYWNTMVTLQIKPDDRLSPQQRRVVSEDYGMARFFIRLVRASRGTGILHGVFLLNARASFDF